MVLWLGLLERLYVEEVMVETSKTEAKHARELRVHNEHIRFRPRQAHCDPEVGVFSGVEAVMRAIRPLAFPTKMNLTTLHSPEFHLLQR
jgi:hypothetical protein